MKREWITFDLDGTLMQNPFGEWVFPEIEHIFQQATLTEEKIVPMLVAEHKYRMKKGHVVEAYDWDHIVQHILNQQDISALINVEKLVQKHAVQPKVYILEENIISILQQLKTKGYLLAAVTNGFLKYQLPVLDALQLTPLFDRIITPEIARYGKPHIKMVDSLIDKDNHLVAHVGDRIDHDVVFAHRLSIPSILLAHNVPKNLTKLPSHLRQTSTEWHQWAKHKWYRETGQLIEQLSDHHHPDFLLDSLNDLENVLLGIGRL